MDPNLVYLVSGGIVAILTIVGFIWKGAWWTSERFREIKELTYRLVKELEDKFDKRHEDNIVRFAKIETKLDIAIKNGHD
jgi:hypothetical protein